ncbi:hypothetical protein AB0M71_49410, partial [Amycolatopsis sp. NPDC051114]
RSAPGLTGAGPRHAGAARYRSSELDSAGAGSPVEAGTAIVRRTAIGGTSGPSPLLLDRSGEPIGRGALEYLVKSCRQGRSATPPALRSGPGPCPPEGDRARPGS